MATIEVPIISRNEIRHIKFHSLVEFRKAIPLLQEVPDGIYSQLDASEFYYPDAFIDQARKELEDKLGCHIMTYNMNVFNLNVPVHAHLCANLKGASLSPDQLEVLNSYEENYRRTYPISFVAYAKPVEVIDPKDSHIYELYQANRIAV